MNSAERSRKRCSSEPCKSDRQPVTKRKRLKPTQQDLNETLGYKKQASLYEEQGKWELATELRLRILHLHQRWLGDGHKETISSKYMLAAIYSKQYRLQEAKELVLEVISARRRELGEGHPQTAQAMEMLAVISYREGQTRRLRGFYNRSAGSDFASAHSDDMKATSKPGFPSVDRSELGIKTRTLVSSGLAKIARSSALFDPIGSLTPVQDYRQPGFYQRISCEPEGRELYSSDFNSQQSIVPGGPDGTLDNSQIEAFYQPIGRHTSSRDGFDFLGRNHCRDLTNQLDPLGFSVTPVAGSYHNDIWQGRLVSGGGLVAIKCPRLHLNSSSPDKLVKRATREAYFGSLIAQIGHPNVMWLMGVALFQGQLALITPWMSNGTLSEYIRKNQYIDRWQLCQQVAEGLACIHGFGMVHGDLKAANVFVSKDGIAKLGDFGNTLMPGDSSNFTATSNVGGGTSRWMARELLLYPGGDGGVPAADRSMPADVFALGMTILEIVTGRKPYSEHNSDPVVTILVIKGEHPRRPSEFFSHTRFGDERWSMIGDCWHMKPEDRPSASEIRDRTHALA